MTSTSETLTQKVLSDDELNQAVGGSFWDDIGSFVSDAVHVAGNVVGGAADMVKGLGEFSLGEVIQADPLINKGMDDATNGADRFINPSK